MAYNAIEPKHANYARVIDTIRHLRRRYRDLDIETLTKERLEQIASENSICLYYKELPESITSLIFRFKGIYFIIINNLKRPNTQWFSLAHELGHFFLHGANISDLDKLDIISNKPILENEADYFANIAFIPSQEFEEIYLENGKDGRRVLEKYESMVVARLPVNSGEKNSRVIENLAMRLEIFIEFHDAIMPGLSK